MMDEPITVGNFRLCPYCGKLLPRGDHRVADDASDDWYRLPPWQGYQSQPRSTKLSLAVQRHLDTCSKRRNDAAFDRMNSEAGVAMEVLFACMADAPRWSVELHDEHGQLLERFRWVRDTELPELFSLEPRDHRFAMSSESPPRLLWTSRWVDSPLIIITVDIPQNRAGRYRATHRGRLVMDIAAKQAAMMVSLWDPHNRIPG